MGYETVKSVEKALSILNLLIDCAADARPLTLSDIAKQSGIPPNVSRNILRTMEKCGYAQRLRHGEYQEGSRCYQLLRSTGILRCLCEVAEPVMRQIEEELRESLLLVTVVNNKRLELLRVQTKTDCLYHPEWHASENIYAMRTTRVKLAWLTRFQLERFLQHNQLPDEQSWPEVCGSVANLRHELKKIRLAGGCLDETPACYAIAVPVMTKNGDCVASLGCYAMYERTNRKRAEQIFELLHCKAQEITVGMAKW